MFSSGPGVRKQAGQLYIIGMLDGLIVDRWGVAEHLCYFFEPQQLLQPPPDFGLSSVFTITSAAPQAGQVFGLQRVFLVAPHFSHLNRAIVFLLV